MNILDKLKDPNYTPLFLAPLAGVTNKAYRTLMKELGADVVVSEMISINGLTHNNKRTFGMLDFDASEQPFGAQIFGNDPKNYAFAADLVKEFNPEFVDINVGCPVKKITGQGAGSALMKDVDKLCRIIDITKSSIGDTPLSIKIRLGWDDESKNYLDVGKRAQEAGADFITMHGRTRAQMYNGLSDWNAIKELKEHLSIPVIGNGDIIDYASYKEKLEFSGVDGVMIGRGAVENPYVFNDIKNNGVSADWSYDKRKEIIFRHLDYLEKYNPQINALTFIRKHIAWYLKGIPGIKKLRAEIFQIKELETLIDRLDNFVEAESN